MWLSYNIEGLYSTVAPTPYIATASTSYTYFYLPPSQQWYRSSPVSMSTRTRFVLLLVQSIGALIWLDFQIVFKNKHLFAVIGFSDKKISPLMQALSQKNMEFESTNGCRTERVFVKQRIQFIQMSLLYWPKLTNCEYYTRHAFT